MLTEYFARLFYYPYSWTLQYALNLLVQSPTYEVPSMDPVPYIDAAATLNPESRNISLFLLNRDLSKPRQVKIVREDNAPARILNAFVLTGADLKAMNSFDTPPRVQPQQFEKPATAGGRTRFELPARSYIVLQWAG